MDLKEGIYNIPDGLVVKILRGARQIEVKPNSDNRIKPGDYRCKDCKHYWRNWKEGEPEYDEDAAVCLASPKDDAFCSEGERNE